MEQGRSEVCATADTPASDSRQSVWSSNTTLLIYMALGTVILHAVVGNRYGFHSDELATLEDARHLAWGFPAYPPVTPFFGRISLILFGTSLIGFRLFASLAHALTVVLAGLMARELGGKRGAQLLAGAAALPFCIGGGALMQYVSFDYAAWVLAACLVVRLLKSDNPRWWVAVGASIGFGMLSKYTMAFFAAAIVASLLLTDARRYLKSKWLWIGAAVAVLVFLPLPRAISGINSFWQRGYGYPAPRTLIVIGQGRQLADEHFGGCRLAGHIWNRYGVKTDATVWSPDIFVCGPPKQGWPEFWRRFRYYG